jgi:RNA polymerase sigma factor (sigma-70 family)
VNVLNEVSMFVAERLGVSIDEFMAVLRSPQQVDDQELVGTTRPFALVAAQILRQLGSEYMAFAEELEKYFRQKDFYSSSKPVLQNPNIGGFDEVEVLENLNLFQIMAIADNKESVDFDSSNLRKFEAEFGKLCQSPVVRNRTKGLINRYPTLGNQVEVDDILAEVYVRALRAIEQGKTIRNLSAWVREMSMNVVRELYREEDRNRKLEQKAQQDSAPAFIEPDESHDLEDPTFTNLWAKFKSLSPVEQQILIWEARGKSYSLISQLLIEHGFETRPLSENAIAHRVRRARKKLKSPEP